MKKFVKELKRRNVIKAAVAYLVVAWILLQVFTVLLPILNAPEGVLKILTLILAIGLPVWIIISWIYDITPQGIEKTAKDSGSELVAQATNKRLNVFIIVSLSVAVIVLVLNQFFFSADLDKEYSIAVIPFHIIKVNQGNEFLGESFALDVNRYLTNIDTLHVIDFRSSRKYKDSQKPNAEIGNELKVFFLITGDILEHNNTLNITARLIEAKSNKTIFSVNYEKKLEEDILKIHQDVAQKIVHELKIKLTLEEIESLEKYPTENPIAFQLFTQGLLMADKRNEMDGGSIIAESAYLFQKAIALDSTFADAYAEMAFNLRLLNGNHPIFENRDPLKEINYLLKKSIELNPKTVRAYTTLGAIAGFDNEEWEKAKDFFDKALAINYKDATTHHYYALYFSFIPNPNYEKALEHTRKALKLNPRSLPINSNIITYLLYNGKIREAEDFYKNNSQIFKDDLVLKKYIINAKVKFESLEKKDWKESINLFHKEIEIDTNSSYLNRKVAIAYNEILNDDINYLKHAKKAFNLEKTYSKKGSDNVWSDDAEMYYMSLLKTRKFKEAYLLLQDDYFKSLFSDQAQYYLKFYYHYYQGNYSEAQVLIDLYAYDKKFELCINYAQQNKAKKVDSILNLNVLQDYKKAIVFAILKERDSMYYYMDKEKVIENILKINGFIEMDLYRKEERYKAFLKKNYLPITHWNE